MALALFGDCRATPPPEQVPVGRVADEGRAGVGFAVGIVLYLALILAGPWMLTLLTDYLRRVLAGVADVMHF